MLHSDDINELASALAKAQGQFTAIERSAEVDTGKYKFTYAPLDCIVDAIRKPLAENGLAFCQGVDGSQNGTVIETMLMHTSGQWIKSTIPVRGGDGNAQAFGSAITYAKRYALTAMLGIVTEDDDDGNKGAGNTAAVVTRKSPPGVTDLRAKVSALMQEIDAAGELDTIDTVLAQDDAKRLVVKAIRDFPEQWEGIPGESGSGIRGILRTIAKARGNGQHFEQFITKAEKAAKEKH